MARRKEAMEFRPVYKSEHLTVFRANGKEVLVYGGSYDWIVQESFVTVTVKPWRNRYFNLRAALNAAMNLLKQDD